MESDRLNSPSTSFINLELLGHQLQFSQEKNCRRGRFCPAKLKGKRVIELGAGCGVAGFGMAMLGCNVVATDQAEVLPLLKRNMERNISAISQMNPGSDSFGSIEVAELDWGNEDHIRAIVPPFDYIIGTDVVYAEHLLEPLLRTMFALSGPKTTVLLGYEIRSTSVHDKMLHMWKNHFDVKVVSKTKMDSKYQHSSIQLFIMGMKASSGNTVTTSCGTSQSVEAESRGSGKEKNKNGETSDVADKMDNVDGKDVEQEFVSVKGLPDRKLSDWEARRYGSMAARLLRDVKIA